jgi:hypothetical protein
MVGYSKLLFHKRYVSCSTNLLFKSSTCSTFLQCHTLDIATSVINKLYSHCWDVLPREGICGIADQEACLTNRTARKQNIVSVQEVPHPLRSHDMMDAIQSQCSRLISTNKTVTNIRTTNTGIHTRQYGYNMLIYNSLLQQI